MALNKPRTSSFSRNVSTVSTSQVPGDLSMDPMAMSFFHLALRISTEKTLRIAWQYKKYFGEQNLDSQTDGKAEYCNDFNLQKPLDRHALSGECIDCVSLQDSPNLATLYERCSTILAQFQDCSGSVALSGVFNS